MDRYKNMISPKVSYIIVFLSLVLRGIRINEKFFHPIVFITFVVLESTAWAGARGGGCVCVGEGGGGGGEDPPVTRPRQNLP